MYETIFYFLLLAILSFLEIRAMLKKKLKFEIISYIALAVLAGVFGILNALNPYKNSLTSQVLNLFNVR